jgi:hypothetical protein
VTETETLTVTEAPEVEAKPQVEQVYVPGKIVVNSWGYDQTNIDYYLIVKRSASFVTLQPIGQKSQEDGWLTGTCTPDPDKPLPEPTTRRKVIVRGGKEIGVKSEFGWCDLWDGKPDHWSAYA